MVIAMVVVLFPHLWGSYLWVSEGEGGGLCESSPAVVILLTYVLAVFRIETSTHIRSFSSTLQCMVDVDTIDTMYVRY